MAIRSVAIPLLSGGALLLGYAAFSWLRGRQPLRAASEPAKPREAPTERESPEAEILELDLEFVEELPLEHVGSLEDHARPEETGAAPEDLGALFLARATNALSPFGDGFGNRKFNLDQLDLELGGLSQATARAANGDTREPSETTGEVPESERRPSAQRFGARR